MTALHLLHELRRHNLNPHVDGFWLVMAGRPPAELLPFVRPLQSGLRAAITGRRWFYTAVPGQHAAAGQLDPAKLIPATAHLLTVESDPGWDLVRAAWRADVPGIFVQKGGSKCG